MRLLLPIFAIGFLPFSGAAADLSFSDCLQTAQTRSLQASQGAISEARARSASEELQRGRLPQLSFLASYSKSDDPATQLPDANKAVLHLEQTGNPLSPTWLRADQREAEYRAARYTHIETVQDALLLVKQLYFSILKEQDAIERLLLVENQLKGLLTSVIPRYTIGRTPPFDLVKIKTSTSDLSRTRELIQAQLLADKSQLALLLGLPAESELHLQPTTRTPPLREPEPNKVTDNPTLQALETQIQAARLGVSASKYSRIPSLVAAFEYGYAGQTSDAMALGWDISLALKLPIFDWGVINSQIAQESATAALAENKLSVEMQRVTSDLIQARALAGAHLSDQDRLKPLVKETHHAAMLSIERYKKGGQAILETTDAISLWIQTLLNERSAYYSYLADLARIDRLQGTRFYEEL